MQQMELDLGSWYGKTSPEHSQATKAATSPPSSKKRSASSSRKPPVLMCLNADGRHGDNTAMWEEDGVWRGECLTRNIGEYPNVVVESRLSQILEEAPQEKYYLTARACQGILNRAERRGKVLPPKLKAALILQSQEVSPRDTTEAHVLIADPKSYGACRATESTAPIPQDVTDADGGRTKAIR